MVEGLAMALSKEEKNARARARYAAKKAASGNTGRGARMRFPVERFPTVKHGVRYGGEGNQVGLIGPPRKYKKRTKKAPPAAKAGTAPPMVRRAVKRVSRGAGTIPLPGLGAKRPPRKRAPKLAKGMPLGEAIAARNAQIAANRSAGARKAAATRRAKKA